jgi:hypothetical protein
MSDALSEMVSAFTGAASKEERKQRRLELLVWLRESSERVRLDQLAREMRQRRAPGVNIRFGRDMPNQGDDHDR